MNDSFTKTILKEFDGYTLKKYLSKILGYSRRMITRLHFDKAISINGQIANLTRVLKENDILEIYLVKKELTILYEDQYLIIVNKPAGILSHPSAENFDNNLVTMLCELYQHKFTPHPIGRLDKNVSGIMVFSKNRQVARLLNKAKEEGTMNKYYRCIIDGNWKNESGRIIIRLAKDSISHLFIESEEGKECITEYKLIYNDGIHSELEIHLLTGKTHQIRATLSAIGYPIIGDKQYRGSNELSRVGLHAYRLEMIHPITNERLEIICPLERDMARIINKEQENGRN